MMIQRSSSNPAFLSIEFAIIGEAIHTGKQCIVDFLLPSLSPDDAAFPPHPPLPHSPLFSRSHSDAHWCQDGRLPLISGPELRAFLRISWVRLLSLSELLGRSFVCASSAAAAADDDGGGRCSLGVGHPEEVCF